MTTKDRCFLIIDWFKKNKPLVQTELHYTSPFTLLVAVILSAQCTDKRVNITTPKLFELYPTPLALSKANVDDIRELIKSISYPNSKAEHLIGMAKGLVENFNQQVPCEIQELMTLPGVGRKTANVVASIIYNKPVIAVDTHVFRVAKRLGLSCGKTVEVVEKDLEKLIPPQDCANAHHWLILHGRYICTARSPKCNECDISQYCQDYIQKNLKIVK